MRTGPFVKVETPTEFRVVTEEAPPTEFTVPLKVVALTGSQQYLRHFVGTENYRYQHDQRSLDRPLQYQSYVTND
jgi:hypothetical protein